jgi:Dockerin type I domain
VARFTVDSRPEIGTWAGGSVYLDINGNFKLDPENADDVNEDLIFEFGFPADDVFAGNFVAAAGGVTDGFDKLAAYGDVSSPGTGLGYRWRIDFDNDGIPDLDVLDPANINGLPAAGRFDANDGNGDEVAVFTGRVWHFDTNHDFRVDFSLNSQLRGYPMVGDFNGDGFDDLGTYNEELNRFEFDLTTGARNSWDGIVDRTAVFGFAGVRERPAAADMDQDGIDGGAPVLNRIVVDPALNVPALRFNTEPFANDLYATFGDEFALPVLGNFDPPLGSLVNSLTNPDNPLDVNADNRVNPLDALLVINRLGDNPIRTTSSQTMYYDVDGNGTIAPLDALRVINYLSIQSRSARGISVDSESKGEASPIHPRDAVFAELGTLGMPQSDDLMSLRKDIRARRATTA